MTRLIPAFPPVSASSLPGLALALAAIALWAGMSAPNPGAVPLPDGSESGPESPSCVGCHSSEWPSPAPDAPAPDATLSASERSALSAWLAPGRIAP